VVVGAASRDLAPDDPRGWRLGGSASYCSLAAARLGLHVGCLLGVDREAEEEGGAEMGLLMAAGVDLHPARLERGPVFENIETDGHRRQRWLSKSGRIPTQDMPANWAGAAGWLIVPVAGEVGEEWAGVPGPGARLAVGWQGMLRAFTGDGWVERTAARPSALLTAAGLVCASRDDLPPEVTLADLLGLAPQAALLLTGGDRGGLVVRRGVISRYRAVAAPGLVDPTGAGDVFLAALMVAWLLTGEVATSGALRFAAAAASCAVEGVGLLGVPRREAVVARLRDGT
jgi:hypothetical protein